MVVTAPALPTIECIEVQIKSLDEKMTETGHAMPSVVTDRLRRPSRPTDYPKNLPRKQRRTHGAMAPNYFIE